jgi:hypothetical protein
MIKKCLLCGKEFEATRASQKYCKRKHYATCVVCHKKFLIKKLNQPAKTCSSHCASILSHNEKSNEKRKENSLKKWGTESPLQAKEIKEKIQKSLDHSENDKRFGSQNFQKIIKDKYGVINASQIEEVKEKKKETMLKHYGVENPMQSDEIKNKRDTNNINKYGTQNIPHIYNQLLKNNEFEKADEWKFLNQTLPYFKEKTIKGLAEYFHVVPGSIVNKIINDNIDDSIIEHNISNKERLFEEIIIEKRPNIKMIRHDRKILEGKELDFYFPDKKLAVEISPSKTHNIIESFDHPNCITKKYHQNKFTLCAKKNIELITIFDWHNWDKIIEMILNKLNSFNNSIYARKTKYIEHERISNDLFNKLSNWHILSLPQNFKRNNQISELNFNGMTVGLALWTKTKTKNVIELKRMVFKPGYSITGGPSKLVKDYLQRHKNIKKIITYSDCDLGRGSVYSKIGFNLIETSKPTLNYYHPYYQWHIKGYSLVLQGTDRLLKNFPKYKYVGKGQNLPSNNEIMLKYGFLPVYDCGNYKWEMKIV